MKSRWLKMNCEHIKPTLQDEINTAICTWSDDNSPRGKLSRARFMGVHEVAFFQIELEDLLRTCCNRIDYRGGINICLALLEVANVVEKCRNRRDGTELQPHPRNYL